MNSSGWATCTCRKNRLPSAIERGLRQREHRHHAEVAQEQLAWLRVRAGRPACGGEGAGFNDHQDEQRPDEQRERRVERRHRPSRSCPPETPRRAPCPTGAARRLGEHWRVRCPSTCRNMSPVRRSRAPASISSASVSQALCGAPQLLHRPLGACRWTAAQQRSPRVRRRQSRTAPRPTPPSVVQADASRCLSQTRRVVGDLLAGPGAGRIERRSAGRPASCLRAGPARSPDRLRALRAGVGAPRPPACQPTAAQALSRTPSVRPSTAFDAERLDSVEHGGR